MSDMALAAGFAAKTRDDWQKLAEQGLGEGGLDRLVLETLDGLQVEPIYSSGETTGVRPMPAQRRTGDGWGVIQRLDICDIAKANEQILTDLMNGATGVLIVLPGAMTSSEHGVPARSVEDFKRLFAGVELDLISVRLDAGPLQLTAAQNLLQVYRDRNLDLTRCDLSLGVDPNAGFALAGVGPAREVLADELALLAKAGLTADMVGCLFCADGAVLHEAGASPALELGLAIASAIETLRLLNDKGIEATRTLPLFSMRLAASADQFATIAKLRAARLLWQQVAETFGCEATPLRLDVDTSNVMMSKHDAQVNFLRTTTATFAAGVGGASSVCVLPYSLRHGLPDAFARRMARNTQIILLEESGLGKIDDAAAGSGYVESLTDAIARKAWSVMQDIETQGGLLAALQTGHVQKLLDDVWHQSTKNIVKRKTGIVGTSEFAALEDSAPAVLDAPLKANWLEDMLLSTDGSVTCPKLVQRFLSEPFDDLRARAESLNPPPSALLVTLGSQSDYTPRATWVRNYLAAGGIASMQQPLEDVLATGCSGLVCLVGTDTALEEKGEKATADLKSAGAGLLVIVGKPKSMADALVQAGADDFFFLGGDVSVALSGALDNLEASR